MKLRPKVSNKISTKLISFLPILKASIDEINEIIKNESSNNPFIEVKNKRFVTFTNLKNAITDEIEALSISSKSFYENLIEQVENSRYFPTEKSKKIARCIIEEITPDGYFAGDESKIAKRLGVNIKKVKSIRQRFRYLEPRGVGAKDLKESFLFQIEEYEIDDELYFLTKEIIENLEDINSFVNKERFKEAVEIIKKLKIMPALEYGGCEEIIPEIIIINEEGNLEIRLNEEYYPEIYIKKFGNDEYSRELFKRARTLVDALEMRKSTLKKIALMIVEFQYDFFQGGVIKPMRIQDIADELEFAPSTISRAISNKYLLCDRGIIPLKNFFSTALDENISANQIKEEIKKIIKYEDKNRPFSDEKITQIVNEKYSLKIVRRTITKYRESLDIPSSRERKRIYKSGGCINF